MFALDFCLHILQKTSTCMRLNNSQSSHPSCMLKRARNVVCDAAEQYVPVQKSSCRIIPCRNHHSPLFAIKQQCSASKVDFDTLTNAVFSASLQKTHQLSVCLVTNPVVSFIPGGRTGGEGASLSEVCISTSQWSFPRLNLHLACTLQSDLKNNPELCSKQLEVHKKSTHILKVPPPACNRSLGNLTCFLCQSLKLDLINHQTAISQAMHLFFSGWQHTDAINRSDYGVRLASVRKGWNRM